MNIRRAFAGPWRTSTYWNNPYLTLASSLFASVVCVLFYLMDRSGSRGDFFLMGVLALMWLFTGLDQLAREHQFWWPTWFVGVLHVLSLVWMAVVIFYAVYLAYVFIARHVSAGS